MHLFSQSFLTAITALAFVLATAFVLRVAALKDAVRRIGLAAGIAVLAALVGMVAINQMFTLDNTPGIAFVIAGLAVGLLALTALYIRDGWVTITLGALSAISTGLLLAVTINSFYHYIPSMGALFNRPQLASLHSAVTTSTSNTNVKPATSLEQQLSDGIARQGKLSTAKIPGTISHFTARDAYVYLPPAYLDRSGPDTAFPVIVLLNGTPGSPQDWLMSGNFENTVNTFAARHAGVAPVIVIPDHSGSYTNDTECVDSSRGNVETYLSTDVPTFIKQQLHVSPKPGNWAIAGLSEGGMCAAMLTLRHQDVYRHFLDMSGEPKPNIGSPAATTKTLFAGSAKAYQEHDIDWLLDHTKLAKDLSAQFVIGHEDDKLLVSQMGATYTKARNANLPASMEVVPNGGHSFAIWSQGLKDSLPQLSYRIGATKCEQSCGKQ